MTSATRGESEAAEKALKYFIDIEGTDYPWDRSTITVPEIRRLGSLDPSQPVIEVDLKDNSERTLDEGETIELKPGRGFARKVRFKRG
jgi:hypothetical protein